MKTAERTATWRRERVALRVSRLTWRLEQAERECARALARPTRREPRSGTLAAAAGLSLARVHQITAGRTWTGWIPRRGSCGRGLAGARRLSALSGSAQRRCWRHADHSLWPVVQVSESHRENVHNGGSASGYQKLFGPLAVPGDGQAGMRLGRIFMQRCAWGERPQLPHTGRMLDRRARWSTSLLRGMRFVVLVVRWSRVTPERMIGRNLGQDDPDPVGVLDVHLGQAPRLGWRLPYDRHPGH